MRWPTFTGPASRDYLLQAQRPGRTPWTSFSRTAGHSTG